MTMSTELPSYLFFSSHLLKTSWPGYLMLELYVLNSNFEKYVFFFIVNYKLIKLIYIYRYCKYYCELHIMYQIASLGMLLILVI